MEERKVSIVNEKSRTYYYDYGTTVVLTNVTELSTIKGSTEHRLKADGKLEIIRGGWNRISIESVLGEWEA